MCPECASNQTTVEYTHRPADDGQQRFDRIQEQLTSLSDILGRKWTLVIIHELAENGPCGFSDLAGSIDGISSKVLSESLDDLEECEFVRRRIVSERPFRVEYELTDRATVVEPLIDGVRHGALSAEAAT